MVVDVREGRFLPEIDSELCSQCGICLVVCPCYCLDISELHLNAFGHKSEDILLGSRLNCYIGHSADNDIRYNSSSGGLVTTLLIYLLENGYINGALITKMNEENPLHPQPFIARTEKDIILAAKTKYCPVPANIALRDIIDEEGKYAVVGLPCHLHGIRKAEMSNNELKNRIILHIGILCSGVPNFKATEYLLRRMRIKTEAISSLEYRGLGWPGKMSIILKNGDKHIIPYPTYWDEFGGLFYPYRCAMCTDWFAKLADISFGDAWLTEFKKDTIGSSIVISRTSQSEDFLQRMIHAGIMELNGVNGELVKKSQGGYIQRRKDFEVYLKISNLFKRKTIFIGDGPVLGPSPPNYIRGSVIYFMSFIASNKRLWWFIDIYCWLLKQGRCIWTWFMRR